MVHRIFVLLKTKHLERKLIICRQILSSFTWKYIPMSIFSVPKDNFYFEKWPSKRKIKCLYKKCILLKIDK